MGHLLLNGIDRRLRTWSRNQVLLGALLFALAVGIADHFVVVDLLIFYLLPLFAASWYGGRREGLVIAVYAATADFVTETMLSGLTVLSAASAADLLVRMLAFLGLGLVFARLRETRRQQEELTGFLVHDLRSPLSSAITGLMTLEQTADSMNESEREMVQLALVSNQRALGLVNSILDVAKMESGTMTVRPEAMPVRDLIDDSFRLVSLWAQNAQVTLRHEITVDQVTLDRSLTERVLVNFLSNALKYSPAGAEVLVRVYAEGHQAHFEVIDHGKGIPPEYVDLIFEPFAQVQGTSGGTGLGLTFCRLAIKAQHGRIGVRSRVDEGSTFWFSLPYHQQG